MEGNALCDGELAEVVANHLGLDLDLVELLARVDANDAANHLGDDNHVAQVRLDQLGLLVGLGLLLGLAQLLDQAHRPALQAAVDLSPGTGVNDIAELIGAEVEEAVGEGIGSVDVFFVCLVVIVQVFPNGVERCSSSFEIMSFMPSKILIPKWGVRACV